ncbi:hypothetical protein CBR_g4535 [Chara braunii]|uniref:alpha,alpha-trehalose-phosphate synthase (UDP-forming) n=1 Tax=Chara braunii TaxID=69332 RepID=A0A388KI13_CHABU|nr:hypothetical protein CBR_g4535 [Chara braunii]|eukprot:GBG69704.1 hypothetical protein CBR_g4535 [Chara braunii]
MADSAVASTGLPYSLSVKTHPSPRSSRDWKDEDRDRDSNSGTPRRRLSMSSSGEFRPQLSAVDFRRDTNSGTSSSPLRARPDESPPSPSAAAASLSKFGVGGCGVGGGVAYQQQQQRSGSGSPRMKHNSSYPSLNNPPSLTTLRMDWQARHGGGGGGGGERNGGGAVCVGGDGSATGQSVGNGDTVDEDRTDSMNQGKGGAKQERLLVVANRLPVCARREADGSWQLDLSAGGLVSALLGVKKNFETVWIGWPGMHVPDEWGRKTLTKALAEKGCVPVFLDEETVDQYYNGYCNNVLWPLFHYIGVTYPMEDKLASTRSLQAQWLAYQFANRQFANVVLNEYREGDTVWCHDYHLMLLPSMLKEKSERMKVGWFLHTPFPSSEIYRTLPLRREILTGVLSSDLIGFHTYDYARHFVSSCSRILGHEGTPDGVENCQTGAITRVAAFPIGIDPDRFVEAVDDEAVKSYIAELRARFAGKKVMLGVDRLDMIKGIPQKLLAFEKFLEEHPDWGDRVILVQIAVPSRTDVPEYQRFSSQVHEIVGRINGRFGTVMNMPIHHLTRSIEFNHLVALYAVTDVALVTSLRDGMNLVSYEFVACQNAKKGVLILSEFAGAAQSLGAGAILVNPWNVSDVASAIEEALTMPEADRVEMHRHNFKHVTLHTAQAWAETFVSELQYTVHEVEMRRKRTPPQLPTQMVVERFADSNNRLLVLGFNATLTRPVEDSGRRGPDQIKEMKPRLHPLSREYLDLLSRDPNTTIVILSGSEKKALDKAFGGLNVWLAAGNGMFLRHARNDKWTAIMPELEGADLRESVQPVFEYFSKRTPGSYLESRETSLIWNYKYADVEFGRVQARDLLQHLLNGSMSSGSFEIVQGTRSIEVRPSGISKGAAMERVLAEIVHRKRMRAPIDFVFVAGKFLNKDEDLYEFFEPRESSSSSSEENECAAHHQPFLKFDSSMSSYINSNEGGIKANRYMEQKDSRKPCLRRCSSMGGSLRQCHSLNCSLTGKYNPLKAGRRSHMKLSPMLKRSLSRDGAMWNSGDPAESLSDGDDQCDGGVALNLRDGTSFSCSVGRSRTLARHMLGSSDDVVGLLKLFAESCGNSPSDDVSVGIQCRQDREGDDSSSWNVGQFPVQLSSVSVNSDMNGNSYSLPHVGSLQCFSTPVGSPVGGSNFGGGVVGTPGHPFGPVRTAPPGSGGKGEPGESPRMQVHLGSGTPGKPGGYQGVPGRGVESPRHHFGGMSSGLSHDSTLHPFGGGVSAPNGDRDSTSPRIHYNSAGVPENLYYSYHPYDNQRDHQFASLHEPTFPYPPNRNGMRSMNGSAMPKPYSVAPRMQATGLVLRREFDALHFPCAQDAGYVPCQEVNYAQDSGNLHAVHPEDNLLLFDSSCPRRWLRYLPRREFGSVPKEVVGVPYEQLTRSTSWG